MTGNEPGWISGSMGGDVPEHARWCNRSSCPVPASGIGGSHSTRERVVQGRYGRTVVLLNRGPGVDDPTMLHIEGWYEGDVEAPTAILALRIDEARILHHQVGSVLRLVRGEEW